MSICDLVSMFLAVELQSYGLYIFATLYRDSELTTSAGLTYFLLFALYILLGSFCFDPSLSNLLIVPVKIVPVKIYSYILPDKKLIKKIIKKWGCIVLSTR
jgi:hypothetical protein